jgi:hypothetical protein
MNRWQNLPTIETLTDHLSQAYDRAPEVSIRRWRLVMWSMTAAVFIIVVLAIALGMGAADPPQHARLTLNLLNIDDLTSVSPTDEIELITLDSAPASAFTLLFEAFSSTPGTAWGAWLDDGATLPFIILVHTDGYFSASSLESGVEWRRFMHIRSAGTNTLRLYLNEGRLSVFINDELALEQPQGASAAGIALYGAPSVTWQQIERYSPG